MIVCVDFDACIQNYGKPIDGAIEALRSFNDAGIEIIVHTARSVEDYAAIDSFMRRFGVKYNSIRSKPYADFYIDDRSINNRFIPWDKIKNIVLRNG